MRTRKTSAIVALLLMLAASPAHAQSAEGNVLSVDAGGDIVIDLGAARGVEVGDVVEVWRPMKFKHPVTGHMVSDRVLIAKVKIKQARPMLSIGRVEGDVERPLATGDVVVTTKSAPPPPAAAPPPKPAPAPAPPTTVTTTTTTTRTQTPSSAAPPKGDSDAKDVDDLLSSMKNAPPDVRIGAFEKFVLDHPQNRHANILWVEAASLRRLLELNRKEIERENQRPRAAKFEPPKTAPVGVPLELAMELGRARGAVLHVRRAGEEGYSSSAMKEIGPSYFAGTIPAEMMGEGTVEYFVEATDSKGEVIPIHGSAPSPLRVAAENPLPPDGKKTEETIVRAGAFTDYASFDAKSNKDYVWQSEAQLGVRLHDVGLRAVRSGFGAYRGRGGTLEDLDKLGLAGRDVGLTYGWLETELAPDPIFSFVLRAIVGLREDGVNGGGQAFIRIGNDRRTNIMLGGEVLGGIGLRGITQLEWNLTPRVPVMLRSEVTNQPAGVSTSSSKEGVGAVVSTGAGEVGIRSIVQVGYRFTDHFLVAGRGSFQARTINHAGPGAGAAVTYEW
jgi:hypothetical protein